MEGVRQLTKRRVSLAVDGADGMRGHAITTTPSKIRPVFREQARKSLWPARGAPARLYRGGGKTRASEDGIGRASGSCNPSLCTHKDALASPTHDTLDGRATVSGYTSRDGISFISEASLLLSPRFLFLAYLYQLRPRSLSATNVICPRSVGEIEADTPSRKCLTPARTRPLTPPPS